MREQTEENTMSNLEIYSILDDCELKNNNRFAYLKDSLKIIKILLAIFSAISIFTFIACCYLNDKIDIIEENNKKYETEISVLSNQLEEIKQKLNTIDIQKNEKELVEIQESEKDLPDIKEDKKVNEKPVAVSSVEKETEYDFVISHYCTCAICCGKSNGITASGRLAEPYKTVAVDTSIIPMGSTVIVDYNDGTGEHYYRADDTGGAIKGHKLDLCVSSHSEAYNLGIRKAKVRWQ